MSEANTENRLGMFHTDHLPQAVDGGLTELRIPGTVTDEQTIKIYKRQEKNSDCGATSISDYPASSHFT